MVPGYDVYLFDVNRNRIYLVSCTGSNDVDRDGFCCVCFL